MAIFKGVPRPLTSRYVNENGLYGYHMINMKWASLHDNHFQFWASH